MYPLHVQLYSSSSTCILENIVKLGSSAMKSVYQNILVATHHSILILILFFKFRLDSSNSLIYYSIIQIAACFNTLKIYCQNVNKSPVKGSNFLKIAKSAKSPLQNEIVGLFSWILLTCLVQVCINDS